MEKDILLICQYFYPEHVSSAILPAQLSEKLSMQGYDVGVICGWPQEYGSGEQVSGKEVFKGVNIKRLKYGTFNNKQRAGRIINFFSFFVSVLFQLPAIMNYKIVLVYSNPPILPLVGYWATKMSKIKLVFIGFDLYPDNAIAINAIKPNGFISGLMRYINKRVYANAEKIVATSDDMKSYMLKNHTCLHEERVQVIPNWYTGVIERTDMAVGEEYSKLRISWELIVLYTGNMGEAQDLDTIVDSIIKMKVEEKFKKVLFVFTGHGSRKMEIEQRLANHHVENVIFFGFLKGQDYIDILNIADICLVSLKRGIEGLGVPSKTYGYFAFGKPVISIMSKETELARNIIMYQAGYNINQGDTKKFIQAIESFVNNPELLAISGKNSLKIHEELYDKSIALDRYCRLVDELMNEKGEPRCSKTKFC